MTGESLLLFLSARLPGCRDQRRTLSTTQIPCGQIRFRNAGIDVWTCSAVTNQHFAAGLLQAFKQKDQCSAAHSQPSYSGPASASRYLSCLSSPGSLSALCTARFAQGPSKADTERDAVDLIPSCDNRQPTGSHMLSCLVASHFLSPTSPVFCALWVTRSSCCLGVHIGVKTALR